MKNKQPWLILLLLVFSLALLATTLYACAYGYYRTGYGCLRAPGTGYKSIRGDEHGRGSSSSPCVKANKSVDQGLQRLFERWREPIVW